jgi:predicted DNA-binding transcriptional regulator YafY
MQSHRLARLLRIIVEVRSHPQKPPEQIAKELHISLRQFYYDRNKLVELGFVFERIKGRFSILHDPVVTISDLPLSEVLALVLATRHLFASQDYSLVRRAVDGLYKLVDHMPGPQKKFLSTLILDVIVKDGFGCEPEILEDLTRAVDEKQRVLVQFFPPVRKKAVAVDPFGFCLKNSKLFLDAFVVSQKQRKRYAMSTIEKIVFTPFYSPEKAQPSNR